MRDPASLIRFEPHLRRLPWSAEMEALRRGTDASEQWFNEPASITLSGILTRVNDLAEETSGRLATLWELPAEATQEWTVPEVAWEVRDSGPPRRIALAEQFAGFEPTYPVPQLDQIRVSRRDSVRLQIAERLRRGEE